MDYMYLLLIISIIILLQCNLHCSDLIDVRKHFYEGIVPEWLYESSICFKDNKDKHSLKLAEQKLTKETHLGCVNLQFGNLINKL